MKDAKTRSGRVACERCGTFVAERKLVARGGVRMCPECVGRTEHPIEREGLGAGAIFRGTFQLIGQGFLPLCIVAGAFQAPWGLVEAFSGMDSTELYRMAIVYQVALGIPAMGALLLVSESLVEGRPVRVGAAVGRAFRSWGALVIASIQSGVVTLVFLLLLVVPGLMRMMSYLLVGTVVLFEPAKGRRASPLARSTQLMYGHRAQAFVPFVAFSLLSALPEVAGFAVPDLAGEPAVLIAQSVLAGVFSMPLEVMTAVVYFKARRSHDEFLRSVHDEAEEKER